MVTLGNRTSSFCCRPAFSLQGAVDILLENDEIPTPSNIFLEPPQPSILTDEESGDEDEGGTINLLHSTTNSWEGLTKWT